MNKKIKFLIAKGLFWIFPLGVLAKLPVKIGFYNLYFIDFLAVTSLIFCLFSINKIRLDKITKRIILFLVICLGSLLFNLKNWGLEKSLMGGLYLLRWASYGSFYFLFKTNLKKEKLKNNLLLSGYAFVFLSLGQYFLFPNMGGLWAYGWDPHLYRLVGTFLDPGFAGILIVLVFLKTLFLNKKPMLCFLSALSLALTYSRSSFLAFILAGLLLFLLKKEKTVILWLLVFLSFTILLPQNRQNNISTNLARTETVFSRYDSWKESVVIFKKYPLSGAGFNNYRWAKQELGFISKEKQQSNSAAGGDSSLLFLLATTGIQGVISYLWIFYEIIKNSSKAQKHLVVPMAFALLIHSMFNNSLFFPWTMVWIWSFATLG